MSQTNKPNTFNLKTLHFCLVFCFNSGFCSIFWDHFDLFIAYHLVAMVKNVGPITVDLGSGEHTTVNPGL